MTYNDTVQDVIEPRALAHFDRYFFDVLVADLSPMVAARFETEFCALLPSRVRRIEDALTGGQDRDEAITALMSLQASATIAGATRLSSTVGTALADLTKAFHPSSLLSARLRRQAQQFAEAYASFSTEGIGESISEAA